MERRRFGGPGGTTGRLLASGDGWTVHDVVCTSGPQDRRYEERHSRVSIAIVAAGTFQYRSTSGRAMLTPGSIMLGSAGHCFECGHEHAAGDRCVAFNFAPEYFERVAFDAGVPSAARSFAVPHLPPTRQSAALVAESSLGLLATKSALEWEEIALRVATCASRMGSRGARVPAPTPNAVARVTRVVREIERSAVQALTLDHLATRAGLSRYHFLRTFRQVTGVTPHQYLVRSRLRAAALRLGTGDERVIDVAYDSGFGDVSNFNKSFRAEYGAKPTHYRADAKRERTT